MVLLEPFERGSLVERTVTAIKSAIFEGMFNPGDRITELELARSLNIGQPAVREALISLEHQGFVTRIPHRGTFVTELTLERVLENYRVREALELLAVRLVRERADGLDPGEVKTNLDAMEDAAEVDDLRRFYEADLAFHRNIWLLSGSETLAKTLETLTAPLFACLMMQIDFPASRDLSREAIPLHREIFDCLTQRSDQEAEDVLHRAYTVNESIKRYFTEKRRDRAREEQRRRTSQAGIR